MRGREREREREKEREREGGREGERGRERGREGERHSCYQTWKKSFKKLSQGRAVVEFILTFSLFYIIDSNFTDLFFSFSQHKLCMPEKQGAPQMF